MTTFYKFAFKIETSWAKKVLKPILETWDATNNIIVCFVYSFSDKKF